MKLLYCHKAVFFFLILMFSHQLAARDIAGIKLIEQISVEAIDETLQLNGAGIRTKFFFNIYVGALYLIEKQSSAEKILKSGKANRVSMDFLYDEVEKKKLVDAWIEGFEENVDAATFSALKGRLDKFNLMFTDMHKGDRVLLDYIPAKGTRVMIKGDVKGMIEGADFNRALLSVWLGKEPVSDDLKDAMLGIVDD